MANTLAVQLYSLHDFEGGMGAAFEAVRAIGIDTIEPWCGAVPDDPDAAWNPADQRELEKEQQDRDQEELRRLHASASRRGRTSWRSSSPAAMKAAAAGKIDR